jgi:MATE family multidrug resistance protein
LIIFPIIKKYQTDIIETFKLSLPIILGRFGAVMMGVTDNVMIGKVGYESLAAAGIANSVFIMVGIIPIGFLIVGSPMISAAISRNDKNECVNILKGCIQTSIMLSLFFILVMLFLAYNFHYFNQTAEVEALAVPYFLLVSASTLPLMVFIGIEQFSDGLEHTKISMFFNVTGLFVNAFINWLLINGHWGFPQMGLLGAGVGTLCARTYMCIGIWLVVKYLKDFQSFNLKMNLFKIDKTTLSQIVKSGVPSSMQFFFEVSAFSLAAIMVGWLGAIPLAAHNVAISIASVTYMISTGFATGASIRVGTAFGVKDYEGVQRAGKSAIVLVGTLMIFSCVSFIVFNNFFIGFFTDEPKVVEVATGLVIIAGIFQLGDGIQVVSIRSLLGINDVNIPTIITLSAYWIVGIPIGYLLCFTLEMGVTGMWIGLTLGLSVSALMLTFRFLKKTSIVNS